MISVALRILLMCAPLPRWDVGPVPRVCREPTWRPFRMPTVGTPSYWLCIRGGSRREDEK